MEDYSTPNDGSSSTPDLEVTPVYQSAVNEITQPDKMVFVSRYLVERWLPYLGTFAFAILIYLRKRCYHNRKTGELRNTVSVPIWEIAQGCKVSQSTVRRELQKNIHLRRFVTTEVEYTYDKGRGGVRQAANSYTVSMDDPIHADDEGALQEAIKQSMMVREKGAQDPKEKARQRAGVAPSLRDRAQKTETVTEIGTPSPQAGAASCAGVAPPSENKADSLTESPLIDYSSLPPVTQGIPETTSETDPRRCAPPPEGVMCSEDSLSLVFRGEKEQEAASPPVPTFKGKRFEDVTEEELRRLAEKASAQFKENGVTEPSERAFAHTVRAIWQHEQKGTS